MDERKNYPSASAMQRLALCPGSFRAEQQCPAPPETEDAASGTRIHAILAGEYVANATGEDHELAVVCEDQANELIAQWANGEEYAITREQRIWCDLLGVVFSGKPDLLAITTDNRRALVIDYKTGRGDVEDASKNMQLRAHAVLVSGLDSAIDEVTVAIVQPLAGKPSVCRYDSGDIALAFEGISEIIRSVNDPNAPRNPSPEACKYCRAKDRCPEALALTKWLTAPNYNLPALTPDEIAKFLDAAKVAESVIDAIRIHTKNLIESGVNVPGWKLKPGATREKITQPETVFGRFIRAGGTQDQFMGAVTIAKGGLKDALREATGTKGKALDAALSDLLSGCTETTTTAPSLVKE